MTLFGLALRNIRGSAFRSWAVALCALLVAGFALSTTMVMRGAENSIELVTSRLGADIVVVPEGSQTKVESALLMGTPAKVWMPQDNLKKIEAIPGVAAVSPQLYLSTLHEAACCTVSDMFLVAYDPATDFAIQPWLREKLGGTLGLGEVVGGTHVYVPAGEQNIKLYGYFVTLRANLEPTGTGIDQTMFMTFDTARDMARISRSRAEKPLEIPEGQISAALVKAAPGADPHDIALRIMQEVPDVTPIQSPDLFKSYRAQMSGLLTTVLAFLVVTWLLSMAFIGLVFSMATNERKRELGVLHALGASRRFVFKSLITEASTLALAGGAVGMALAVLSTYLFRTLIVKSLGITFILPSPGALAVLLVMGLVIAMFTVLLAAALPAYRVSRQDPATAMRE